MLHLWSLARAFISRLILLKWLLVASQQIYWLWAHFPCVRMSEEPSLLTPYRPHHALCPAPHDPLCLKHFPPDFLCSAQSAPLNLQPRVWCPHFTAL